MPKPLASACARAMAMNMCKCCCQQQHVRTADKDCMQTYRNCVNTIIMIVFNRYCGDKHFRDLRCLYSCIKIHVYAFSMRVLVVGTGGIRSMFVVYSHVCLLYHSRMPAVADCGWTNWLEFISILIVHNGIQIYNILAISNSSFHAWQLSGKLQMRLMIDWLHMLYGFRLSLHRAQVHLATCNHVHVQPPRSCVLNRWGAILRAWFRTHVFTWIDNPFHNCGNHWYAVE
jgi:hypothetical protein